MGVKSGMNYGLMESLIDYVDGKKEKMNNVFTNLIEEIPPRIAAAYDGEAAESYKTTLTTTSNKMDEIISDLIAQLKANAEQKQADYQAQDAKLSASVDQGTGTGGAAR